MATATETVSTKTRFTQWIADQLENAPEISLPALKARALREFGDDVDLWQTYLPHLVYEEVRKQVSGRRAQAAAQAAPRPGRTLAHQQERAAAFLDRWYEHVGTRHIRLGDMTREDLLAAAVERTERGQAELHRAHVWRTLAEPLRPGQTVRDGWSPEALTHVLSAAGLTD